MAMSFPEIFAATLSGSWSHKLRALRVGAQFTSLPDIKIPDDVRREMAWLERITGGEAVIYGGCFDAWRTGKTPRDIDATILSAQHPLVTWSRIIAGAAISRRPFGHYLWRHSLPWKRVRLQTQAGLLDIGCLRVQKDKAVRRELTKQIADNADYGAIAASGTLREQFFADRFVDDHARGVVSCRRLSTRRDYRNGVFKRLPKYMLDKYPERPFEFECAADARFFRPLLERRAALLQENPSKEALTELVRSLYQPVYGFNVPRS